MQGVNECLAGRIGILDLYTFSQSEAIGQVLMNGALSGAILETRVFGQLYRSFTNRGIMPRLSYFRKATEPAPAEATATATPPLAAEEAAKRKRLKTVRLHTDPTLLSEFQGI